jgi:hypothetical protein
MPRSFRILAGDLSPAPTFNLALASKQFATGANFARTLLHVSRVCLLGVLITLPQLLAAQNPIPLINQPLIPASTAPGGPGFTLSVEGTGFVPGAVVKWNSTPRPTTFVNSSRLTAII